MTSLVGFCSCALLLPPFIAGLKKRQIGQFIREEGPKSHSTKARTPTMGGICFIAAFCLSILSWLIFARELEPYIFVAVVVSVLCGAVGVIDDLSKLKARTNSGLPAWQRLGLETILGVALAAFLLYLGPGAHLIIPPVLQAFHLDAVIVYPLFFVVISGFLMAATTNAVNLHDGMDGLAAGTSCQVLAAMAIILLSTGQLALACLASAAAGSICAFLLFNRHPASVFMGDTGSLFIGGLMATLVISGGLWLWFIPLALIYIVETLSVIFQVVYFKVSKDYKPQYPMSQMALIWMKLTKRLPGEGKRLLRMAPLHHHFEAIAQEKGIEEWQVVLAFWLIQLAICMLVLFCFFTSL